MPNDGGCVSNCCCELLELIRHELQRLLDLLQYLLLREQDVLELLQLHWQGLNLICLRRW